MAYIFFTVFAVMNIVNGIFVDGAIELSKRDREILIKKHKADDRALEDNLIELLQSIDDDFDGYISFEEFLEASRTKDFRDYLAAIQVEISDARRFFAMLDEDNSGSVSIAEFVSGLMHLRGDARRADIHMMLHGNNSLVQIVQGLVDLIGDSHEHSD